MTDHNESERRQRLADAVTRLPQSIEPPIDQWPAIERRIDEGRVVALPTAAQPARFAKPGVTLRARPLPFLAAAGLLIVAMGGAYLAGRSSKQRMDNSLAGVPRAQVTAPGISESVAPSPVKTGGSPDARLRAVSSAPNADRDRVLGAFDAYEDASRELSWSIETQRSRLDPGTLAVLDTCLKQIDKAIAEARAALGRNPHNRIVRDLLRSSYRQKLYLLKRAAEGPLRTL